jgi:hypothetical protein
MYLQYNNNKKFLKKEGCELWSFLDYFRGFLLVLTFLPEDLVENETEQMFPLFHSATVLIIKA